MWYTPSYKRVAPYKHSYVHINATMYGKIYNQQILLQWNAQQLNNLNFTIKALILTLLSHIHFKWKVPWRSNFMVMMKEPSKNGRRNNVTFLQYNHNQNAHISKYFSETMSIALHFLNITAIGGIYAYTISVMLSSSGLFVYMAQYTNLNTSNL